MLTRCRSRLCSGAYTPQRRERSATSVPSQTSPRESTLERVTRPLQLMLAYDGRTNEGPIAANMTQLLEQSDVQTSVFHLDTAVARNFHQASVPTRKLCPKHTRFVAKRLLCGACPTRSSAFRWTRLSGTALVLDIPPIPDSAPRRHSKTLVQSDHADLNYAGLLNSSHLGCHKSERRDHRLAMYMNCRDLSRRRRNSCQCQATTSFMHSAISSAPNRHEIRRRIHPASVWGSRSSSPFPYWCGMISPAGAMVAARLEAIYKTEYLAT